MILYIMNKNDLINVYEFLRHACLSVIFSGLSWVKTAWSIGLGIDSCKFRNFFFVSIKHSNNANSNAMTFLHSCVAVNLVFIENIYSI